MSKNNGFDPRRRNLVRTAVGGGMLLCAGAWSQAGLAQNSASATQSGTAPDGDGDGFRYTRDNCCLLMIDYQTGIMSISRSQPAEEVIANAITLLAIAKVLDIPVIFTSSEEQVERKGKFVEQLTGIVPDAYANRIKRTGVVDSFGDPAFAAAVRATGRKNLVLGGISTEECVSVPALSALGLGYNVKVIADACSSYSAFTDNIQFNRMMHYGIDVTTVRQFAADMIVDWSQPESAQIYKLAAAQRK